MQIFEEELLEKKTKKKHISMKQIGRKDLRLPKRMSENQQSSGKRHFSEERNIFGSDGRKKVWRKPSTSLKTKKIKTNCQTWRRACKGLLMLVF